MLSIGKRFCRKLWNIQAKLVGVAYYHKLMISPSLEIPVSDFREWTRNLMRDLEEKQGKKLHWFAVQHHNTEHPHVHIIIAGAGENLKIGKEEAIFLRHDDDFSFLKKQGKAYSDFDHQQLLQETLREMDLRDDTITSYREFMLERGFDR